MNTILSLIKTITFCMPFVFLCIACYKINLPKAHRYKQYPLPVFAIAYCLIAIFGLEFIHAYIFIKLENFFEQSKDLMNIISIILPEEAFAKILADMKKFIEGLMIYAMNTVFVTGFLACKTFILPLCKKFWNDEITRVTSIKFYRKAPCYLTEDLANSLNINFKKKKSAMIWILRPDYRQKKYYFGGFYIALFVVSMLLFVISQVFKDYEVFQSSFYPVFGVLILGEIFAFLNGLDDVEICSEDETEKEEPDEEEETQEEDTKKEKKKLNYLLSLPPNQRKDRLRVDLRILFIDRDLQDSYIEPSAETPSISEWQSAFLDIEDNHTAEIALEYFSSLEQEGKNFNINDIHSAIRLIQGKSVLICNPFYQDLTHYLMLPIMRTLLRHRKCLILPGRESAVEDIKEWMTEATQEFVGTPGLWRVNVLSENPIDTDIGIMRPSDIYHLKLHQHNADFFERVGFVLLIEPSHILATGQIGLSMIVHRMHTRSKEDKLYTPPVFCACDRNCDGLVDVLSHTLRTNLTEVAATPGTPAGCSQTTWRAEGTSVHNILWPNIARFLDLGTSLAAAAMKNHVPAVTWISSEKFPVIDMKWFAGQYYRQICQYAGLPSSQAAFNQRFEVQANLWKGGILPERFLILEDEFHNLFELHRIYASRADSYIYLNVISENYILRDYMVANLSTFMHDPKAIPTIVPEFARTERNTALKLVMMMAAAPLSEAEIAHEFTLCGIPTTSVYQTLQNLLARHCNMKPGSHGYDLTETSEENGRSKLEKRYFIDQNNEIYRYAQNLTPAYFITEDETGHKHLLGAMLYGHVYQAYLPGQFIVHEGKYYEIRAITSENGVILRRAADHINHRNTYRQSCHIALSNWQDETSMGAQTSYSDIVFQRGTATLDIQTDGYIEMPDLHDFSAARFIAVNNIPTRQYINKTVLRISLPNTTVRQRLTLCLILNEIFRTTYPDSQSYIHASTELGTLADALEGNLKYIIHAFSTENNNISNETIQNTENIQNTSQTIQNTHENIDKPIKNIENIDEPNENIDELNEDEDIWQILNDNPIENIENVDIKNIEPQTEPQTEPQSIPQTPPEILEQAPDKLPEDVNAIADSKEPSPVAKCDAEPSKTSADPQGAEPPAALLASQYAPTPNAGAEPPAALLASQYAPTPNEGAEPPAALFASKYAPAPNAKQRSKWKWSPSWHVSLKGNNIQEKLRAEAPQADTPQDVPETQPKHQDVPETQANQQNAAENNAKRRHKWTPSWHVRLKGSTLQEKLRLDPPQSEPPQEGQETSAQKRQQWKWSPSWHIHPNAPLFQPEPEQELTQTAETPMHSGSKDNKLASLEIYETAKPQNSKPENQKTHSPQNATQKEDKIDPSMNGNNTENIEVIEEPAIHPIDEENAHLNPDIYIIEDSAFDLGLLVSVERYIRRYFEISTDYMMWHQEIYEGMKFNSNSHASKSHLPPEEDGLPAPNTPKTPQTLWERIVAFFRKLFKKGPTEEELEDERLAKQFEADRQRDQERAKVSPVPPPPWMRLGYDTPPESLDINGLIQYMQHYGFDNNSLTTAREYQKHHDS